MSDDDVQVLDIIADELSLARAQLDSGLPGVAEGTLRRRIAYLEADGADAGDELDAVRVLLAEALYRQGRPIGARLALDAIGSGSSQRRRPIAMLIEAEALAAVGEPDRAAGLMERVVSAVGVDEAWRLRAGTPTRLAWPLPAELRAEPRRAARPPWAAPAADDRATEPTRPTEPGPKVAAARARLAAAREAYTAGEADRGDHELSLGVRLDPAVAADGVALLETTLAGEPDVSRLLLYGDLLRAAGREVDASAAYDRAAQARG